MDEIALFLYENRLYITVAAFIAWIIYALYHTGKLKIRKPLPKALKPPLPPIPAVPAKQPAKLEITIKKLQKEVERQSLAIAKMKMQQLQQAITKQAEEQIATLLPEKLYLFDAENQLVGRPIYFFGGIPCINKRQTVDRLVEKHLLSRLASPIIRWLYNKLFFTGDTLYFYNAQLLPNGRWALTATSKPPKKRGNHTKLPTFCKQYVLLTSEHQRIDDLITNKWEVSYAKAAIQLAATFLGPFSIEEWAKLYGTTGWSEQIGKEET